MINSASPSNINYSGGEQNFKAKMKNLDEQNHQLQFFQNLFNAGPLVHLDPNNQYALVKTQLYKNLHQNIMTSRAQQEQMAQQLHLNHLRNLQLQKQLEICEKYLKQSKRNEQFLLQKLEQTNKKLKEYDFMLLKDTNSLDISHFGQNRLLIDQSNKQVESISIQTEYYQHNQLPHENQKFKQGEISLNLNKRDQEQQKLYQIMHESITFFEQQFKKQVALLSQQQISIQDWQRQNQQLSHQNAQLRQKIKQIKVQEQQISIWQAGVGGLIKKLQSTIAQQSNTTTLPNTQIRQKNQQQIQNLKNQVIQLRGRIVEMRKKMKYVQQIMEGGQEIQDQGAVGVLVRLSQKIKSIVKTMIMQIQQV